MQLICEAKNLSVPEDVVKLLVRLAAGWRPSPLALSGDSSLSWNNGDFACTANAAHEQDDGTLIVDVRSDDVPLDRFFNNELRNKPCGGDLPAGKKLIAQLAHVPKIIGDKAQIECFCWHVWSEDDLPRLWIAPVTVRPGRWLDLANMAFDIQVVNSSLAPRRMARTSLYLKGEYDYHLLLPEDESGTAFLIIDTRIGALPQREILHREFLIMQYVLGQQLRLRALGGVNHRAETVAHTGGPYGTFRGKDLKAAPSPKCPISDDSVDMRTARAAAHYAAALFSALANAEREHPELGLLAAMTFYLTSMGEYLENAALKLHVALEGLASNLFELVAQNAEAAATLKASKALYLTRKHADWKAWCAANAAQIREMSRPEVKDAVLDAVRRADKPGASQIVPTMLQHYNIPLVPEVSDVLAARNVLVHQARLPNEDNFDTLLLNESVPRALLVALIAKASGYDGPIRGYGSSSPSWWPAPEPPPEDQVLRQIVRVRLDEDEWGSLAATAEAGGAHD